MVGAEDAEVSLTGLPRRSIDPPMDATERLRRS
jgi:hypothetical protein